MKAFAFFSASLMAAISFAKADIQNIKIGFFDCYFHNTGDYLNYEDGYEGTMDWDLSTQLGSIANALNTWANVITSPPSRDVRVSFTWIDNPNFLAAAGGINTLSSANPSLVETTLEVIWKNGESYDVGDSYDINVIASTFNFDLLSFSDDLPQDKIDFQTIMAHEVGHAMGFMSLCVDGDPDQNWNTGYYTAWDLLMRDEQGRHPDDEGFEYAPGATYAIGEDGLTVYNPDPILKGSSMSHIDELSDINPLMAPRSKWGERYGLSEKELSLLREMGWAVAIPEPSSSVLLIASFGFFSLMRRKNAA